MTTRRNLELSVTASQEVLFRVLGLLQRRRCRVLNVDYVAGDRHNPGRLTIAVEAPAGYAHCLEHWVGNLVDVMEVRSA
jgi:acetolactate synthase small subunit